MPFYPPLPFLDDPLTDAQQRELVFGAVSREIPFFYDALPQSLVDAFLAQMRVQHPGDNEHIRAKPHDDLQHYAAKWHYARYTLEELQKQGWQPAQTSMIGLDHIMVIETVEGDAPEGLQLATKYHFEQGADHIRTTRSGGAGTAYLSVIEKRYQGDGLLFLGGNEHFPSTIYTVGFVWAPRLLMEKYRVDEFKSLPGY